MAQCQPCPMGSYSLQTTGLVDFRRCPSADSPKPWLAYGFPNSQLCSAETLVTAGAVACTLCPPDRPYTWGVGSKSVGDCKRCPVGQFFSVQEGCQPCTAECSGPYFYESVPCTEETDRECLFCDYNSCRPSDGEYVDVGTGCPGEIDAGRPCARCVPHT